MLVDNAKANKAKTKEKEKMGDKKPNKKKDDKKTLVPKKETPRVVEEPAKGKKSAGTKKKK
jgi:hypothetical protein